MRFMILALILIASSVDAFADDGDWCGPVIENEPYELRIGSLDLRFPAFLEIVANGRTVFAEQDSRIWAFPYSGLLVAETEAYVLIEAYEDDCVDLLSRRIFVLSKAGDLLVSKHIWTSNWEDAFFLDGDGLVYWSEWFCHPQNADMVSNGSYAYVWPGSGAFEKERRPLDEVCAGKGIRAIRARRIDFVSLEPAVRHDASGR